MQNSDVMKVSHQSRFRGLRSLVLLFLLPIAFKVCSQDTLRIMPIGNSITFDTYTGDVRADGDKVSYRYQLYQELISAGYTFDFVGSERSGWNYLPTTPADYSEHAGFPGISAADLLTLLQTGLNYEIDPVSGFCELPSCPQNYLEYYHPDVIFLHIGTNGLTTNADAEDIAKDVEKILDLIDAYEVSSGKTVPVFLARIINRGGTNPNGNHAPTTYYNTLLDDLVDSRPGDSIIQVNMETGAGIDYRFTLLGGDMRDTLHPVTTGYNKMAKSWFDDIEAYNIAVPSVSDIPDQSRPEGTPITFDLDDYVFDPQDTDAEMTWTYSGNTNFTVSINASTHMVTITPANPNWNGSNTITFRATDPGGAYDVDAATYTMTAVNDTPTDITLSGNSVQENQPTGTLVGTLSTTDVDAGDSFTYTLVSGTGSTDNNSFTISGNQLLTNAVFDYETKSTLSVRIRTTDSGGLFYEEAFTISVININEAPVLDNIETSALNYTESSGPVSVTSTITVTDDNTNLQSATITISSGYQSSEDVLSYSITDGFSKTWNASTGTFTLQGSYSLALYQAALRNVKYTNTSADPVTTTRTVTFTVYDGTSNSVAVTRNITIGSVNNAPVLGNLETTALSYTENEAAKNITNNITITDSDDANMEWATATISSNYQNGQDVLAFTNANGIIGSWNAGSGILTLNGTATIANYRTALRNISYRNTSENPSVLTRSVSFRVNDGELTSDPVSRNISITAVNDAPVLSGIESPALTYTEGDGAVFITSAILAADDDNASLQSATITISSGYQSTQDVLSFTNANGITGSWSSSTGVLTLSGTSLISNYQAALRSVRYINNSDNPVTTTRTITFLVNDGTAGSNTVSRNISLVAVNDPPVLGNIETATMAYTENNAATDITATLTITDNDDINLTSATVSISGNYQNGEDVLSFTNADGITSSWNATTGTLTLSGTSLVVNYRNALRNVAYNNTSENPSVLIRTISFTANDGEDVSNTVTRTITVTSVNDAPVLSGIETIPLAYMAGSGEAIISSTVSAADADNINLASATVAITGNYRSAQDRLRFTSANGITGTWITATGIMTLSGTTTLANYITALRNVRYENIITANPNTAPRTVQFQVNDGQSVNNLSNTVSRTISYVPTATISGGGDICGTAQKDTIVLNLTGEPNWTVVIRRTGGTLPKDTTISGIAVTPYSFLTNVAGTYVVYNVSDKNYADGLEFGTAVINVRPAATAKLTGTSQICQDATSSAPMSIDFTGTAPWTFILRRNAEDTMYTNITQDPFNFTVKKQGTYRITSLYDQYCEGDTVPGYGTAIVSYITSPKATISGVDTVCPGDTAILSVQLEGTGPFSITYLRNGANPVIIDDITQLSYILKVVGNGTYTLSEVEDHVRSGCVSGTGTVVYYSIPTANISGTGSICEHTSANLRVALTGTAPWSFSYHRNTEVPTNIANVTASPRFITVNKEGTYTLVNVSDKYCKGTVSGNAVVTITPAPDVSITGLAPAYSVQEQMVPVFGTPTGGSFTPPVLIMLRDTNFFLPAIVGVGLHTLVYSYRDNGTGCYGYDTAIVAVLAADAEITFPENDTKKLFCYNDPPFTILGHNVVNNVGSFTISGGIGLVDNHDNTATIYPSQLADGIYMVTYRYYNNTFLEVEENFEIEVVPDIRFIGLDDTEYCNNEDRFQLDGNISAGIFSGKAVTGNISTKFYYEPRLAQPGLDTIFYTYTTSVGCSRQIYQPITIRGAAVVNFTVQDTCFSSANTDSAVFINLTTSIDPVNTWSWTFGDIGSGDENTSGLENPKHRYTKDGLKEVRLEVETPYCSSKKTNYFKFGAKPTADFEWASECYHEGRKIRFINQSSSENPEVTINGYEWKFYHGETYDSFDTKDVEYLYSDTGEYNVELIIHSNFGCTDRKMKILPLRPTYPLAEGASYFEGFENGYAGWKSNSEDTVNSWTLDDPTEFGGTAKGEFSWYTHITDKRPFQEHSYITSPCFDFTGIKKPMVKMFINRRFDQYRDGANLQFTVDSGMNWINVGKMNDGINWYNNYDITGNPGGRTIGWSSAEDIPIDNDWVDARHSIDELRGKNNVQFRIAYGSDGTATNNKGMAFDNFWIGERNKIVLAEHFTNTSDINSMAADEQLDAIAHSNPLDIVDIQYHTSFPGTDPFNEVNKVDPGTRVLFYELSAVPYSIINGGAYVCDYDGKSLDPVKVKTQALTDPKFNINLQTSMQDNTLEIEVEIIPLEKLTNHQVTLYLAIIEHKITGVTGANGDTLFESVLKKIISSTSYTNNWEPGVDVKSFTTTWNLKNTYNPDELRVIAFIQDEATKEIYQAMIDKFDPLLALEEEHTLHQSSSSTGFIAFPNPVNDELYLKFMEAPVKKSRIDLFDINGKLLMTEEIFPGIQLVELYLGDFPEGFYFLRITSDNQFVGLQKLVISR